jgi:hypothetical protein
MFATLLGAAAAASVATAQPVKPPEKLHLDLPTAYVEALIDAVKWDVDQPNHHALTYDQKSEVMQAIVQQAAPQIRATPAPAAPGPEQKK